MKLNLKRFSRVFSLPRERENFFRQRKCSDGGWLKIRFFVRRRPRAVLDRAPREKEKYRKIPVQNWNRVSRVQGKRARFVVFNLTIERERERDGSTLFSTTDSLKFRTGFEKSSAPLMKIAPDINRRSMKPQTEFVPTRIRFFISGLERHVSLLSIILYDASVFVARNDID